MAERIILNPDEVESYVENNRDALLCEQHLIAENPAYGVSVYLSCEEDVGAVVSVETEDDELFVAPVSTFYDVAAGFRTIYDKYLTSKIFDIVGGFPPEDEEEEEDDREDELLSLAEDFLAGVYEASCGSGVFDDGDVAQFLESALDYLANNVNSSIRRPLRARGSSESVDYPYECVTFSSVS